MRAAVIPSLDGPAAVTVTEVAALAPDAAHDRARGERLLIEVKAVGLSFIDVLQSRGAYQYGTPTPYVTGSEVAGVVVEADPASGFLAGDRVGGIVFWGGAAEQAVLAPLYTVRLPDAMPFDEGAALYLNYSTAWYAYDRARVGPGQTVLVHGASGGVGTAALDLAASFGARAIAVVSSDEKGEIARRAGAAEVVRSDVNWLAEVQRLTDGHGVDAVLDTVGGDLFTDSLRATRVGGILVVIGFAAGAIPQVKVNRLLLRNLTVTGISMDTMDAEHPGTLARVRDAVQELAGQGRLHPLVGARYPLGEIARALADIDERRAIGKVVVEL